MGREKPEKDHRFTTLMRRVASSPADAKKREMKSVWRGRLAYEIYRAVTRAAAPALYCLVEWRRRRRWWRKQGNKERVVPFAAPGARPPGTPLVWIHAVSLGEALAALPLVRHHYSTSSFVILMTTTTFSALYVSHWFFVLLCMK